MRLLGKLYAGFSFGMSAYGFSRGYRSNVRDNKNELTSEKLISGLLNGMYYGAPVINIGPTIKLINRLEIEINNLDKDTYKDNYQEFIGICKDTL